MWRDLGQAVRGLRRSPGFATLATLVLALGVGTTSTMFALVDAALVRPLPFVDPARLMMIWERPPSGAHNRVAPLNYLDWSEQNQTFSAIAAVAGGSRTMTGTDGVAERIPGQAVTARFFDVLGIMPVAGRTFVASDDTTRSQVVVLSERLWRSRFGSDPSLIGRRITLDGLPYTVIGIVPARFEIMFESQLWTLFVPVRSPEQRRMHYLQVVGRLKDGVSLERAQADMTGLAARVAQIAPETNKGWGVSVEPLRQAIVSEDLRATSLMLGGVVLFVLLMACANVANLLVTRGAGRSHELAVRAALGGSRSRLLRQLLTESAALAAIGGAIGLAGTSVALRVLPALLPPGTLPPAVTIRFDSRVAAFAVLITAATTGLSGLAPSWQSAQVSLVTALKAAGRASTGSGRRQRMVLAAAQIAAAVVLLCGAVLLLRTFDRMQRRDAAYARTDVLTMQVALPLNRYPNPADTSRFYQAVEQEIERLPGVQAVAFGDSLPLDGWNIGQGFEIVGDPPVESSRAAAAHYQIVGTRYFDVLGIPLAGGRAFTLHDGPASEQVCIVSESFVAQYARGRDPLGMRLSVQSMGTTGPVPVLRTIVGVAPDVPEQPGQREAPIAIYVPIAQNPWYSASLSIRAAVAPMALLPAIKAAGARVDPSLALTRVRTMAEVAAQSIAVPRFRAWLVGAFAATALVLAGIGIFGVLAFSVHQRTREFGIRLALGAHPSMLLRLVVREGLVVTGLGLAAGMAGAAVATRSLATLLYGVEPLDPLTFLSAPAILGLIGLAACAAPALRASRVAALSALGSDG